MKTILSKFKKLKNKKAVASLIAIVVSVVVVGSLSIGTLSFLSTQARETAKNEINNTMNTITDIAEANRNNADISIPGGEPIIPPEQITCPLYFGEIYKTTVSGIEMSIIVNEDGSAVMDDGTGPINVPAGYLTFDGLNIYADDGEGPVQIATVAADGKYLNYSGITFTLVELSTGPYYLNLNTMTIYDEMPATVSDRDLYLYGDYVYYYHADFVYDGWQVTLATTDVVSLLPISNYKWTDRNQTSYDAILESINGKPVVALQETFRECKSLEKAPAIPSSVKDMSSVFLGCTSLTEAPVIPNSVTDMGCTFQDCTSLTDVSDLIIPSSVTHMSYTFMGCTSLTEAPDMSQASSVTDMFNTFNGCTSLTDVSDVVIPSSVTHMYNTFKGCTSLTKAPDMSNANSVTNMDSTFWGCTALEKAPAIPNSVTRMDYTFQDCTALEKAPVIPNSVTNMWRTFYNCTFLTGEVEINANPSSYGECFKNTVKPIKIVGSTTLKAKFATTANNGNVTY